MAEHFSGRRTRAWIYRYQLDGKRREMGLGGLPLVSLADARSRALTIRAGIKSGGADPPAARREAVAEKARVAAEAKAAAPKVTTFATSPATTSVPTAPGARQHTCRLCHAVSCRVLESPELLPMTLSRSGLSVTALMGVQFRVWRDQRAGLRAFASVYTR